MAQPLEAMIARELGISMGQVERTVALLSEGATLPFIARYRKEQTGSLDETQIEAIAQRAEYLRDLEARRVVVLASIEEQGKLTPELRAALLRADTKQALEDLYLPFRPKRRTRAMIAREKGYEPLALAILAQAASMPTPAPDDEALAGARDIVAEMVSERAELRAALRKLFAEQGDLRAKVVPGKEQAGQKFADYFDHHELCARAPSHRVLALERGKKEGFLRVSLEAPRERALALVRTAAPRNPRSPLAPQLDLALEDAYDRLLHPSLENDVLTETRERADLQAIEVFAANLRNLLLASPLGGKPVVALDPGLRTGCKLVALSAQGDVLAAETCFPLEPKRDEAGARRTLARLLGLAGAHVVAVGNGTGGREAEAFLRRAIGEGALPADLTVVAVSEAGASVYSASELARQELPSHDVTVRGAVSIGRRLQDPLAELVKIDPKSIGVGQYQHDVDQPRLRKSLDRVVESCVNHVGVDVNTASPRLLSYVAGIGPTLAQNIVTHRAEHGRFASRQALRGVARLGPKAFEQAAGFLRVPDGSHPLDASAVHPERYGLVEQIARDSGTALGALMGSKEALAKIEWQRYESADVGAPTLRDIAAELEKPGRDPRVAFAPVAFRPDVTELEHVTEGMVLDGVVTNVAAFGAFVDIGVHQDGLVHISELAHRFVRDPGEVVKVGDRVRVKVTKVDRERKRIGLSIKQTSAPPAAATRESRPAPAPPTPPRNQPFNPIKVR